MVDNSDRPQLGAKISSTEFRDPDSRTTVNPAHYECTLCSSCHTLLLRTSCDQKPQMVPQNRSEAFNSAKNGCIICGLVIATQATKDDFMLAFNWYHEANQPRKFACISLVPEGTADQIKQPRAEYRMALLVLEDGIIYKVFPGPRHN
jgi:hypothetical protein